MNTLREIVEKCGAHLASMLRLRPRTVRVGWILSDFSASEGLRQLLLLAAWPPPEYRVTHVLFTSSNAFDRESATDLARHARLVYAGPDAPSQVEPAEVRTDRRVALQEMVASVDLVVVCGFPSADPDEFGGRPVVLYAGTDDAWARETVPGMIGHETHLMATSRKASEAFPEEHRPRVQLLPPGIDLNATAPIHSRDDFCHSVGLGARDVLVGCLVPSWDQAGAQVLRDAVEGMPPEFRLVMFDGPGASDAHRAQGRAHRIPRLPHIGDLLHSIDVAVLAAPGSDRAWLEAAAAGVPVVAAPLGIIEELEEQHGPLVVRLPSDATPGDLAAAVLEALDPGLRDRWSSAQRLVFEELGMPRMRATFARFVQAVMSGKPPTPPPSARTSAGG